jgi:hypothetical protein
MRCASASLAGFALMALLSTPGCGRLDVVAKRYDTLAGFEDKGWLPKDILPPSTRNILTENNLDIDVSRGRFEFDPKDAPVFVAKVETGPLVQRSNPDWSDIVDEFREAGLSAWHYSDGDSDWALFCDLDIAYCEYRMWPHT